MFITDFKICESVSPPSLEFYPIPLQSIGNLFWAISPTPVVVADTGGGGGGAGGGLVSKKIEGAN